MSSIKDKKFPEVISELSEANQKISELEILNQKISEMYESLRDQTSNAKLIALSIDTIDEGVAILSQDFTVDYVNSAYCRITGRELTEMLGNRHPGVEGFRESVGEDILKDLQSGIPWKGLFPIERSPGEEIILEQSINPIFDDIGVCAFVILVRDITEELSMESTLRQAQKLESIGLLASGIAHEINTPTQYVGDNLKFLSDCWADILPMLTKYHDEHGDDDLWQKADMDFVLQEMPSAFEQATQGLQQIRDIVLAMKNFAHPGTETKEKTNVNNAISDVILIAQNEYKYAATITTDLSEDLPEIPCIRSEINQVILNMIVNAAHAISEIHDEPGKILISTEYDEEYVSIIISDNGAGMNEKTKERIFDPFFTTKGIGKGSGQGLAITYSIIIEHHEGTIEVDSLVGEGTTFTIRLPLACAE